MNETQSDPHYNVNNIPPSGWKGWERYRKKVVTQAMRLDGPFTVETSEGVLRCADGWLCLDARGYPYPVAADEFELIYEPDLDQSQ